MTLLTDNQGRAQVTLAQGVYDILIDSAGYLARVYRNVNIGSGTYLDLSASPLLGGDFNDDGVVNSVDYSAYFYPNYRSQSTLVDLDASGEVNNLDYSIMRNNWSYVSGAFLMPTKSYAANPSLKFNPSQITTRLGNEFEVGVEIDTAGQKVAGTDAVILFDNTFIEAVRVERGHVFSDYPALIIDNEKGKVIISAVVKAQTSLFSGQGNIATVIFKTKAVGTNTILFDYQVGKTNESNIAVTTGNGDILGEVNNLAITSQTNTGAYTTIPEGPETSISESVGKPTESLIEKIINFFKSFFFKSQVDPYEQEDYLQSKTDPVRSQPMVQGEYSTTRTPAERTLSIVVVISIIVIAGIWTIYFVSEKISNRKATVVTKV